MILRLNIADEISVDVRTLQNYEKDETTSDATVIAKLAKIFNIMPQELLGESVVSHQNSIVSPTSLKKSQLEQIKNDQIYIRELSSKVGVGENVDVEGAQIYDTDTLVPFSAML